MTATITRTYDGLDRLTQEVTAQGTVNYVYDNASRRTSMTVAGQTAVAYIYDNANRLTQVQQGTSTVTLAYDSADRRTSLTLPNTNSLTYAYNVASELTSLTYKKGATVLGDLTYTYDAAGNRMKTGGTFARSGLPPVLTTTSYNANNQQTTFGTNTETYDLNGNLATVTDAGSTVTYTWNARNQLVSLTSPGFSAAFTYDSFGRRTGKTVQGVTTNFVYDGLNPVQEKAGTTVTANLLTGLGIDEFFTRTDGVGTRGLLTDALGSTVALGDGAGTLQTQYTYEPFGITTQTGSASTSSYKYTGREDDGTGLMYYRARYYHPRLQRFISEDPIGFAGGDFNLYGYVSGNPVTAADPFGLFDSLRFAQCIERYRNPFTEQLPKTVFGSDCSTEAIPPVLHIGNATGNLIAGDTGRMGIGGTPPHPTTWQHKMGSRFSPSGSQLGRAIGRATVVLTIFEGLYDLGLFPGCALEQLQ